MASLISLIIDNIIAIMANPNIHGVGSQKKYFLIIKTIYIISGWHHDETVRTVISF